jgi:hypothetical protein
MPFLRSDDRWGFVSGLARVCHLAQDPVDAAEVLAAEAVIGVVTPLFDVATASLSERSAELAMKIVKVLDPRLWGIGYCDLGKAGSAHPPNFALQGQEVLRHVLCRGATAGSVR